MTILKIKLKGQDHSQFISGEDQGFEFYKLDQAYTVMPPTRSDVPEQNIELQEDEIIELEFTDDTVWIGDSETLRQLFPKEYKRSGEEDVLYLPDELEADERDRGIFKKIGVKLVKVFVRKKIIRPKMRELAFKLENKQLAFAGNNFEQVKFGILARCSPDFELREAGPLDSSKRHLLFLHGTASSTKSSFGDLSGTPEWKRILDSYGEPQILAFQHRSLTASPLENVLELAQALPDGIELDLISQSRGGLVADVLARFCASKEGFDASERALLLEKERDRDLEVIAELENILGAKKIKIRRMIRVASPANGTTLASNRLNIYLNVTFNLIGLATGQVGNPIFITFKEMIMEAVACKDDATVLPGLESLNPTSPFIKALNFQATTIEITSPLFVIGGSSELSLRFKSLIVVIGKFFFRRKNDLVVDTESMKWGGVREEGKTLVFIEQSGQIDHFKYFSSLNTLQAVAGSLESPEGVIPTGFEVKVNQLDRGAFGIEGGTYKSDKVTGDRPVAVLLPGIMGSNLSEGDNRIWIDYVGFLKGDLKKLAYLHQNDQLIQADSLIATSYKSLGKFLEQTYDVVTFQFDWRKPLQTSASLLNSKLRDLIPYNQPIKLIGHSMGGVLVRDFIAYHPETWKELNQLPDFRALFLGSPLGGSYRIPYVLFGKDSLIQLLGKIDIKHSLKELLEVFCNFPGILNLLPINFEGIHDFSDPNFWEKLRTAFGDESWPIPSRKLLEEFSAHQKVIKEQSQKIDWSKTTYIAGQSSKSKFTISNLSVQDGELKFFGTNAGDESVTWKSGIPAGLRELHNVYYANVTHGGLSKENKLFAAIEDLLIYGRTSKLQNGLPKTRGDERDFEATELEEFDISEANVVNTILGVDEEEERWQEESPVQVFISHGDLKYAKYPVLAGHFEYDAVLHTEKAIDRQLKGELTRLHLLGLYPGAIGTNQIILNHTNPRSFKGGIIVGLGVPGELSSFLLMKSIEKGIARYLTILNESSDENGNTVRNTIGVSVIAIANSYGGLSTDSSVRAIILGIQRANRNIRSIYKGAIKGIEEVEIIEIYYDKALSILKSVQSLESSDSKEFNIIFKDRGLLTTMGRRWRMPYDNSADWWTRITVIEDRDENEIRMSISTTGASEKVERIASNDKNLDILLKEMTINNQFSPEIAKTMFELLIPYAFKEELKRQNNISWVLDLSSAEYPWEMMQENLDAVPLCIHTGMVRQLATMTFRDKTARITEKTALVVGDPVLDGFMPQLAGAKKEAELVADLLQKQEYKLITLIRNTAPHILMKLVSQKHKIIHLAGHGVFQYGLRKVTGMVIGDNSFLTPGQIAGMSSAAELVFVNCCYLGQINSLEEVTSQNRNKFAANIGTQLINNGVRAVLVAGWAVDDAAALEFAKQFYQNMFEGICFGEAVKRARKKIYEEFGSRTNTWGAFQCYGDPFFKLQNETAYTGQKNEFLISEEYEIELQNLLEQIQTNEYETEYVLSRVKEIEAITTRSATGNDRIMEVSACIYASLGAYEDACRCFSNLMQSEKSQFSVHALEQYCSLRIKRVDQEFKLGKTNLDTSVKLIDDVIAELKALLLFGSTSERWNILGNAYKLRLFMLGEGKKKEMLAALEPAITAYFNASEKSKHLDPFSLTNWLTLLQLKLIVEGSTSIKDIPLQARKALEFQFAKLEKEGQSDQDYNSISLAATIALTQFILGMPKANKGTVMGKYQDLMKIAGRKSKREELDQLELLTNFLSLAKNERAAKQKKELQELKDFLISIS